MHKGSYFCANEYIFTLFLCWSPFHTMIVYFLVVNSKIRCIIKKLK